MPAGTVTGTRLNGVEIALWRDPAGQIHAWHDLCPHRGMRLSLGFLRDGSLACPYHGWRFDSSGRCVHIPAHPRAVPPASVSVRRYHAAEALGMVWVSDEPFDLPSEAATPVRSVTIHRPLAAVAEALKAHCQFADALGYRTDAALYALQPVDEQVTAVHIVALGTASANSLLSLARDAATLRAGLEAGVGAAV